MVPQVFDRDLLVLRRKRADHMAATGRGPSVDFLFERMADDLEVRLAGINRRFDRVLYLGHQSAPVLEMLKRSGKVGEIICTDRDKKFLERAGRKGTKTRLSHVVCDEEALPFASGKFDLCISALGMQFANDLPGALLQLCELLKPDGLFLGVMAGGQTLRELRDVLLQVETEQTGGVSPRVSPFLDVRDAGGLLQRAGFRLPVADADFFSVTYAHLFDLVRDLRALGATNLLHERSQKNEARTVWMEAAALYQEKFSPPGQKERIYASCELVYMTGWRAHESQQKPLKPGSATASLAEAVKRKET